MLADVQVVLYTYSMASGSQQSPPPPVAIPDDVPRIYTNFVLLQPGAVDVTLVLGHQLPAEAPVWSVRATMSWEEAKIAVGVLQAAIAAHEETFGEVRDVTKIARELVERMQAGEEEEADD